MNTIHETTNNAVLVACFVIPVIIFISMMISKNSIHMAIAMLFGVICGISALAQPAIYRLTHSHAEYQQALDAKQSYMDTNRPNKNDQKSDLSDNASDQGKPVAHVVTAASHEHHHKAHAVTQDQNQATSEPSQPSVSDNVNVSKNNSDTTAPKPNTVSTHDEDLRI